MPFVKKGKACLTIIQKKALLRNARLYRPESVSTIIQNGDL